MVNIRPEMPEDVQAVHKLIERAFGQADEADLVDALRVGGDLVLSLVAEGEGQIIGHIALSRLKSPPDSLALAPVCVEPLHQNKQIGSALINEALRAAGERSFAMVFVLGEPAYYERFGFSAETAQDFPCQYAGPYFMALELAGRKTGTEPVIYADAFDQI